MREKVFALETEVVGVCVGVGVCVCERERERERERVGVSSSVTRKKSPNVYTSCTKINSLEK